MSRIKKILLGGLAGFLVLTWVLGGIFYYQATHAAGKDARPVPVNITHGMTLKQVSNRLADQHLIRSALCFQLLATLQKKQNQIQVGEYEISPSMLPVEILDKFTSGKTVLHPVTIPEGYRITEIATLLAQRGLADREQFIRLTRDKELIDSLGIPWESLEGYLFPETYHFNKYTSERKIIQVMVNTFKKKAQRPEYLERAKSLDLTFHQIVTLASLIEKETGVDEERKLISSVFHNRLKMKMRLQADPTVIYAMEDFDGNLRKKDLSIDSPYNTYRYGGLPPGPISSPGLQSIIAALYPDDTNNLYFVSRQDGSHEFSSNLIDHNRAVKKYQLKRVNNLH